MDILDGARLLEDPGVEHFKTASTFGAVSSEAIAFLLCRGRVLSLADGEEIFNAGEPSDTFVVVLQGLVDCLHQFGNDRVLVRTAAVGENIGYVSMIGLFERLGVARSRGPSVLLEISWDLFHQVHIDFPFDFGILLLNLSRNMARTIRALSTQYVEACLGQSIA